MAWRQSRRAENNRKFEIFEIELFEKQNKNIKKRKKTKKEQEWIQLVGKEKWDALSKKERNFLMDTAGKIDLGPNTNLERMSKYIEDYEDY